MTQDYIWMGGVTQIKPIEHVATWRDHNTFGMESAYVRWFDCDDVTLRIMLQQGMHIRFTNERPMAPKLSWWQRLFGGKA